MATTKIRKPSKKSSRDDITATKQSSSKVKLPENDFPIVGIGASAGGLEAFEQFFTNMPFDSGMAFVLIQHLDPAHKSILTELVGRFTKMKVLEVQDGMLVETNTVYVIPPNHYMAILHGKLHLLQPTEMPGPRVPIDFFFRSLANDLRDKAIAIVLSGTGTEGALGIRAIKGEGGMAMVQDPDNAKYDGMPRHAIATGLADYIISADKMPKELMAFVNRKTVLPPATAPSLKENDALEKVFVLIRAQTGHDFSFYKRNTILRRIDRRMALNQVTRLQDYVKYMQENPREADTLFKELLIGVTGFFRDADAFKALKEKGIESLCQNFSGDRTLRIWVPGCSTGEEAYSIAIICKEVQKFSKKNIPVQIFATDIDANAIEFARIGTYPNGISVDVPPDYLGQYFRREDGFFRINKEIRDTVVFALQNVITDPPFSRIDLISCRNLLIYLTSELQKKILPLFHYSLNTDGLLFLGTSETIGEFHTHFSTVDRKNKIYRRITGDLGFSPLAGAHTYPTATDRKMDMINKEAGHFQKKVTYHDLVEDLIMSRYSPAGVVINEKSEVVYVHGRTGRYLEPATGDASWNIAAMAREGLRLELAAAIRKAMLERREIRIDRIVVKTNGGQQLINLVVIPVDEPSIMKGLMIVLFEEITEVEPATELEIAAAHQPSEPSPRTEVLEQELRSTKEYLQTTIEELETSNEELKSTNEELQSSNEELQSTNEELETSKEELQSVNEELTTVNSELQQKIDELSKTSSDLNNLLASTQIGTIFLDTSLKIQRYTPTVTKFVNLIQSDVGRPLAHLVSNLLYDNLVNDAQDVLEDLAPRQHDVQSKEGRWYSVRILPYRTIENVIDGVVITFFEISDFKKAQKETENALRRVEATGRNYRQILDLVRNVIVCVGIEGQITFINDFAQKFFKYDDSEILGQPLVGTLVPEQAFSGMAPEAIMAEIIKSPENAVNSEYDVSRKNGSRVRMAWTNKAILGEDGSVIGAIGIGEQKN